MVSWPKMPQSMAGEHVEGPFLALQSAVRFEPVDFVQADAWRQIPPEGCATQQRCRSSCCPSVREHRYWG